ncbi:MAG TPA: hypothetical protein ENI96_02955 [Sedimenticola thiotaurini]|uniref:Lipopeptide n=1 Tax=Sedimenticola thiotaurini TaxID=1543721 RepID=A0A831W6I9_9GAMM|nr:hypothetical protein [Sedimenticola thiotaurini]
MRPRILPLLLALVLAGGLSACGQKGDLYLPDEPAPERAAQPE